MMADLKTFSKKSMKRKSKQNKNQIIYIETTENLKKKHIFFYPFSFNTENISLNLNSKIFGTNIV